MSIYLKEASLTELLAEISRRFEELEPVPEWAMPVVAAVAAFYDLPTDLLRSRRRTDSLTQPRHLAIALLAQIHPRRSRAEVCEVLGLEHHMYAFSIRRIEERTRQFPEYRQEVRGILQIINETKDGKGHCRTSPQVARQGSAPSAS